MYNLRKTILFGLASILTLSIFITSCQQDSLIPGQSSDVSIEDRDRDLGVISGPTLSTGYPQFNHNGQWFQFSDKRSYNLAIDQLTAYANSNQVIGVGGGVLSTGGKGTQLSSDPLDNFENHYGHKSLRKKVELEEDQRLLAGEDPARFQSDLDSRGFVTDVEMSLINEEGVVQLGSDIYIAYSKSTLVKINGRRADIVQQIITSGTKAAYLPANSADVEIINVGDVAACTAEFAATPGNLDNQNNEATYSFLWNNGNASGVTNLLLQWDFGDGNTEASIDAGTSHTYTNLQPYPATNTFIVNLTATYTDADGTTCNETHPVEINIALESTATTVEECDVVSGVFAVIQPLQLGDLNPYVKATVTPGNPQEVCLNTTGLVNLASSILDLTWRWNFQGQMSSDVSPCFTTPCDGDYVVTLELLKSDGTVCGVYTKTYDHNTDANCQGHSDITREDDFEFTSGSDEYKACIVGKHRTKEGWWPFDGNKIKAKMKTYKKNGNDRWRKEKMDHEIYIEGNVYPPGNGCACGGVPDYVQEDEIDNNTKKSSIAHDIFSDSDGIYCQVDDPYTIRFVVNDGLAEESLDFPQ